MKKIMAIVIIILGPGLGSDVGVGIMIFFFPPAIKTGLVNLISGGFFAGVMVGIITMIGSLIRENNQNAAKRVGITTLLSVGLAIGLKVNLTAALITGITAGLLAWLITELSNRSGKKVADVSKKIPIK